MDSTKGYIHVYTGNGKGKTTAAFGLAVRALCAGKSVYIGQFVKSMLYNETKIGQLFDQVKIEQLGRGCFIGKDPEAIDIRMARDGLTRCAALLESGEYDVVILDELTIALHFGLLTIDAVLDALNRRHPAVEVVVTGRYAPQELIDAADLVTEMREIKHYYTQGVLSRDGIDLSHSSEYDRSLARKSPASHARREILAEATQHLSFSNRPNIRSVATPPLH